MLLLSCYEPVDGCLDRDATNFSVSADFPCANNDCCTYPRLAVRAAAFWGGEEMRFDTTYEDRVGNAFQLSRLRLYLSEIQLPLDNGSDTLIPIDSVDMRVVLSPGDTIDQTLNSNLVLIDQTSSTGSLLSTGEFLETFNATELDFRFGFRDPYSSVVPESLTSGHPLARQEGLLNFNDGNGYVTVKIEYQLPAIFADSILSHEVYGDLAQTLTLPNYDAFSLGTNLTIDLIIDHQQLFEAIDLSADSAALTDDFLFVLPQVVSISSISQE